MTSPVPYRKAVFRLPGVSFLIPFLFFIAVTPLANAGADAFLALYLIPLVGLIYILITRTVADPNQIRTMGLLGGRKIPWSELDGLEFRGPRWAIAVALDGRRVRLPMVRPRDLPRLAAVSGGRLLVGRDAPAPVEPDDPAQSDDPDEPAEAKAAGAVTPGVPETDGPTLAAPVDE